MYYERDYIIILFYFTLTISDDKDYKRITDIVKKLIQKVKSLKFDSTENIANLCPWLAAYHWHGGDDFIEMLGQYTGQSKPNLSRTLKIVKFIGRVTIFHSQRRPIKITVLCSDGKEYSFIVKYGEDLQVDERIQQVQQLMTDQMKGDKNCSLHKLSLRTYKVIPLNKDCGILGWVENTEPIKEFLLNNVPDFKTINLKVQNQYAEFVGKFGRHMDQNKELHENITAALNYSPEQVSSSYRKFDMENEFFWIFFC